MADAENTSEMQRSWLYARSTKNTANCN